jgi:hypothetical protein
MVVTSTPLVTSEWSVSNDAIYRSDQSRTGWRELQFQHASYGLFL